MYYASVEVDDEGCCGLEHLNSFCEGTATDFPPQKEERSTTNFLKASEPHREEEEIQVRAPVKSLLWCWQLTLGSGLSDPLLHAWIP